MLDRHIGWFAQTLPVVADRKIITLSGVRFPHLLASPRCNHEDARSSYPKTRLLAAHYRQLEVLVFWLPCLLQHVIYLYCTATSQRFVFITDSKWIAALAGDFDWAWGVNLIFVLCCASVLRKRCKQQLTSKTIYSACNQHVWLYTGIDPATTCLYCLIVYQLFFVRLP